MRVLLLFAACLVAVSVAAVPTADAVPALSAASAPSLMGVAQVLFALLLVLFAIFACAWLLRRFGPGQFGGNAHMRVVGGVMVGPKERVVIVEVQGTWLVLGVTPTAISTLHSVNKPEDLSPASVPLSVNFAERLVSAIGKRRQTPSTHAEENALP